MYLNLIVFSFFFFNLSTKNNKMSLHIVDISNIYLKYIVDHFSGIIYRLLTSNLNETGLICKLQKASA